MKSFSGFLKEKCRFVGFMHIGEALDKAGAEEDGNVTPLDITDDFRVIPYKDGIVIQFGATEVAALYVETEQTVQVAA